MDISSETSSHTSTNPQRAVALIVKVSGGQSFTVEVPPRATIGDIKILSELGSKIPRSAQRIFFKGKVLNDNDTLEDKGIPPSSTLFMVKNSPTATLPTSSTTEVGAAAAAPVPCEGKCGFYGSPALENHCSKCHKEKKERDAKAIEEAKAKLDAEAEEAARPKEGFEDRDDQVEKNRCWECTKKIGLTGVRCRCGYFFCSSHRYAESHNCDYDYKTNERRKLTKQNPIVQADKLSEKA